MKNSQVNISSETETETATMKHATSQKPGLMPNGETAVEEWFDYNRTIKKEIKSQYGTIEQFCKEKNYRYTDFGSKLKTVQNKFNFLNEFLIPLGFKIKIELKDPENNQEQGYD